VKLFEDRNFLVTVVFDGRPPPAKGGTSQHRRERREKSAQQARALHDAGGCPVEINKLASAACAFDGRVTAEIATRLRARIGGVVYIAPGEADPQLVVFQDIHLATGANVYVYANDSDLTVLGVRDLLLEVVKNTRGELVGRCVRQRLLFQPTAWSFLQTGDAHRWLRQLHGIHTPVDEGLDCTPLPEPTARRRLLLFAMIVGNEFAKFKNVGPVTAARLAFGDSESGAWAASLLPFDAVVGDLASRLLVESREEDTPAARREVEIRLRACHAMFTQPVVWNPLSGELQHFSGAPTSDDITRHTGTLELSPLASAVARGDVCPLTGREWDPPLGTAQAKGQAGGEDAGRQKKRATPETASSRPPNAGSRTSRPRGPPDTNNYREHGFSRLPGETEDYTKWTVPKLREFLSVFRCLDNAGTSGFNKALLAQMAGDVVRLIRNCGVLDTNLAFRHPVPDLSSFEEKEARLMPDLPATGLRIKEWSAMRRYLPEISKAVILRFMGEVNKFAGEGSRMWYRSLQRVLDMGNLSRFWAVPAAGGIMWIGISAGASFSADKEYRVRIKLRVEEVDENAPPTGQEEKEREEEEEVVGNDPRSAQTLVALEVIAALCECPAGIKGGCSHAAMALFLGRLLQMSEEQLATFNPTTCTGMACRWIMQHCKGSRSAKQCDLYGMSMSEGTTVVRSVRDPKGNVGWDDDKQVHASGVPPIDRMNQFNPHPTGGMWAERNVHFDAGENISKLKRDKLMAFVNHERRSDHQEVCLDYLPPRVREDSNSAHSA
ncbi:unnamed protein product, partial [Pylaiella littoralis]